MTPPHRNLDGDRYIRTLRDFPTTQTTTSTTTYGQTPDESFSPATLAQALLGWMVDSTIEMIE